ncbi:MAG TPA: RNA polymerase sigma-70 factor [Sphingobacterium sp.]|nr:RNA polymerase sigma-70 factor [Sphingobacterium sp.]
MQIEVDTIQGERKKWELIYERFYQPLCYFSYSILKDQQKAQDVVQSVLVKLWQEKVRFDDIQHMHNYLYKSVRNASVNEWNAESNHSRILKGLGDRNPEIYKQDDHFHTIVRAELYKHILDAAALLPEKTAEVFKLAFFEQKTNPEIAEILAISINTVKVHKNNAKKALQQDLKDLYPLVALILWDVFQ